MKILIPRKAVYRLSLYQRSLQRLKDNRISTVSSAALAHAAGVKSTQLRKDLAYFGQFGTRGLGYDVEALSAKITSVLGTAKLQPVILIGAGNLGSALMHYHGFAKQGFEIVAAFDQDSSLGQLGSGGGAGVSAGAGSSSGEGRRGGKRPGGFPHPVYPMLLLREFVERKKIKMAILTIPGTAAQEVANELISAGIHGILNFSPVVLQVPRGVYVNNVDLAIELENLSYFIQ
jgi:redox-sensing transcriptional repressor